ncbi:LLM class F420-dependent oxidoreductase [Lentzea sp. NPDC051838]|uniref:LLM class F420-dependent oxidoreductase n=1 Tax=Lentzea sp. NPDC051838 TaxID=3154849 RepID=UPI0034286628
MNSVGVVTPFWLDRPPLEALSVASAADEAGFGMLWIGEMATFDAFALATAVGLRTSSISLAIGPLAAGVRSPVALALGLSTVVATTGRRARLALGASSPRIVSSWHGRPFTPVASVRAAVRDTRALLNGNRIDGFRLQQPVPGTSISVAAFGPALMRVAASEGDEVVLNLVSAAHVASVAQTLPSLTPMAPPIAVWVPAALDPGPATLTQLRSQLAVYLGAPGYGEMFIELGHDALVSRARAGEPRASLAPDIPLSLLESVGAIGSASSITARVDAYFAAGAAHVGLVPATAEDPGGERLLTTLSPLLTKGHR